MTTRAYIAWRRYSEAREALRIVRAKLGRDTFEAPQTFIEASKVAAAIY